MAQNLITFNLEDGLVNFKTPIIEGKLDSFIIDSLEKVSITITSSFGYLIFHNSEHHGIRYYAPRAIVRGPESLAIQMDQFDKFNLNEELDIRISGPKNAEVKIIIRTE